MPHHCLNLACRSDAVCRCACAFCVGMVENERLGEALQASAYVDRDALWAIGDRERALDILNGPEGHFASVEEAAYQLRAERDAARAKLELAAEIVRDQASAQHRASEGATTVAGEERHRYAANTLREVERRILSLTASE